MLALAYLSEHALGRHHSHSLVEPCLRFGQREAYETRLIET
ncbi:hypothetical protein ABIB25_005736 [Nakamurella sp. UYEF19]